MRISDWSSDVCSSDLLLSGGIATLASYWAYKRYIAATKPRSSGKKDDSSTAGGSGATDTKKKRPRAQCPSSLDPQFIRTSQLHPLPDLPSYGNFEQICFCLSTPTYIGLRPADRKDLVKGEG